MACDERVNRRMYEKEERVRQEMLRYEEMRYREELAYKEWSDKPIEAKPQNAKDMLANSNFSNPSVVRNCMRLLLQRIEDLEAQLREAEATKEVIPRLQQMEQELT